MVESTAMIDLDRPPVEPPEGCVDPSMWRLARDAFAMHEKTEAGECVTCPRWKVCPGTSLAKDGLATALGMQVKESPYWIAFAGLMSNGQHVKVGSPC